MPFQDLNQIRKKDEIRETANLLEKIVDLPELNNLSSEVLIAEYIHQGSCKEIYRLFLTTKGFEEYYELSSPAICEVFHSNQCSQRKLKSSEFERTVLLYDISLQNAEDLYSKLKN